HTRLVSDWSSDVCSSDLTQEGEDQAAHGVDLAALVLRQHIADLLLQKLDGRAAVDVDRAVDPAGHGGRLSNVVLVLDLAHDLLRSEERRVGKEMTPGCCS